jgi:hypothetical protein
MADNPGRSGNLSEGKLIPLSGWKIRFDAPPGHELTQQVEDGHILALFRAWDESRRNDHERDRRHDSRYNPAETQVWVGWWNGARFFVIHAQLVNLSKGGALVNLANRPPLSQPVWVCLGSPHPVDHVQARVLDTLPQNEGEFHARLEFHVPCPTSFFVAAGQRVEIPPADV